MALLINYEGLATFKRGKDKKKRKKKTPATLGGHIVKGAGIAGLAGTGLGMALSSKRMGFKPKSILANAGLNSMFRGGPAILPGAAIGAGVYGAKKLRDKVKKK